LIWQASESLFVASFAIVIDNHLPVRLSFSLPDDRFIPRFVLFDDGCSVAISIAIAVAFAYSDADTARANSDTDANVFCARRYRRA
jgi:hypothetical protein